jgi:CheY-like chemotaxis protein
MTANLPGHMKINLESSTVLIVDENQMSQEILASVFYGFGTRERLRTADIAEAKRLILTSVIDLLVLDIGSEGDEAFDFMHWLRLECPEPQCFVPTIIIAGHSTRATIKRARDSGAHFVVAKPITAGVLLNRLAWIAHEKRPFVKHDIYAGPDRRWRNAGVPPGSAGRRAGDLSAEVGDAQEPNMSQDALDALFKPQKISI